MNNAADYGFSIEGQLPTAEALSPPFYTVAIFLVDRAYGGPEEGGWWYACGTPCDELFPELGEYGVPKIFTSYDDAMAHMTAAGKLVDEHMNKGRRPISSVLSEGKYRAVLCEGYPAAYPETRPHYE